MNNKYLILCMLSTLSYHCTHAAETEQYIPEQHYSSFHQSPKMERVIQLDDESYRLVMSHMLLKEIDTNFDYSDSRVSDIKSVATKHIDDVLGEIGKSISRLTINKAVLLNFTDNYLQDEGLEKIHDFILQSKYLTQNLTILRLRNNRLTEKSLSLLKEILTSCPQLTVDVSINNIDPLKLKEYFAPTSINGRLHYSVF